MWDFIFFFQVALENTKICVQLSIFKTDQAFPDTLPWICGIFPQNSHLCGRDVFSCLKNTPWHTVRLLLHSVFWAFILKIKCPPKESSNHQKSSRISAAVHVTLPSLGLVLSPSRRAGSMCTPGEAQELWWGDDCGLLAGLEGTKDRCGLSSHPKPERMFCGEQLHSHAK